MKVSIGSIRVTKGLVRVPRQGMLWGDAEIEGGSALEGQQTLTIGDVSYLIDIVPSRGGTVASQSRFQLRQALAWDAIVNARGYQSSAGVRVHTVLRDLALAVGASIKLPSINTTLGEHYQRRGNVRAREILRSLCPAWYVSTENVVQCDARPSGVVSGEYRILDFNLQRRVRTVGTEKPSGFVPGLTIESEIIEEIGYSIVGDGVNLSVWSVT